MTVRKYIYKQARGLSGDTPPPVAQYTYLETDTGRLKYTETGASYQMLRGADMVEVLQNKTIDIERNEIVGLVHRPPFAPVFKKSGAIIPAASAIDSVHGALFPLRLVEGDSAVDLMVGPKTVSSTDGVCVSLDAASPDTVGYSSSAAASTATDTVITRREWNPYLAVRCKVDNVGFTRLYIGYNAYSIGDIAFSNTPLTSADSGVIVGYSLTTNNYSVFHNSGAGAMSTTTITAGGSVAKDANFHTFEITMSSSNAIIKLDGAHTTTISTNIPAASTELRLFMVLQCEA
jgi:hypothetical protein